MANFDSILEWQNLIYLLPGMFAVLLLLISMITGAESDHDMDHDAVHDVHSDHDHDDESGMVVKALGFIGFGRVPLMLFFVFSGLSYAVSGLMLHLLFQLSMWESFFFALAFMVGFTAGLSQK
jgi:hypothetical protein